MRLISLNVWRGKLMEPLLAFLGREAPTTDIFCFQEMFEVFDDAKKHGDVLSSFRRALPECMGFFRPAQRFADGEFGLAMFIKKSIAVTRETDIFVHRTRDARVGDDFETVGRNLQVAEILADGQAYSIFNFQGLVSRTGRGDTEERIEQSKKVKEILNAHAGKKIIAGDFNLSRDTESMAIIDAGMRNLIKESGITSTRNRFFVYPDKFCDYILADNEVSLKNFAVLNDEVSDHLPLVLDF